MNSTRNRGRNGRGGRGRGRNNGGRNFRSSRGGLRRALNGQAVTPSADPSTVVELPWNTITLTFEPDVGTGTSFELTIADVYVALGEFYAPTANYEIRILEARLWEISGKAMGVDFLTLDTPTGATLKTQDDIPGRNHWARCGFVWPRSHQNLPLFEDETAIIRVTAPADSDILIHLNILWRLAVQPPEVVRKFRHKTKRSVLERIEGPDQHIQWLSQAIEKMKLLDKSSEEPEEEFEDSLSHVSEEEL